MDITPAGPANHERRRRPPAVMSLGHHIHDLVESTADEVHELKFRNRAHAGERCTKCSADNCRFCNWRIDHALETKAVDEAIGYFESAAVDSDIFAQAEDGGIAIHFFTNALTDGFEIRELGHVGLHLYLNPRSRAHHFKCTAASTRFRRPAVTTFVFGVPYFG